MVADMHWRNSAACADVNPEIFFPSKPNPANTRIPFGWCAICPVSGECLKFALDTEQMYGIFGGTLPSQRKRMLGRPAKYRGEQFRVLAPHGSEGAIMRHRRSHEKLCDDCAATDRERSRRRKAAIKAARELERVPA